MPEKPTRIERALVVEPDPRVQRALDAWLTRHGFLVTAAPDAERAMSVVEGRELGLLIVELDLPGRAGETPGLDLVAQVRQRRPGVSVIALCAEERFDWAVGCLRLGVLDYVIKPARLEHLGRVLAPALERRQRHVDAQHTAAELQIVTDELLRHLVRLFRETHDLRDRLETATADDEADDLGLIDEYNVLCVSSDRVLRESLDALVAPRNMRLTHVPSGEDALRLLDDLYFNLVVVDAVLPGIDGVETVRRIHLKVPDTELLVVVGFTSADSAIRAMELGASAFLVKPLERDQAGERLDDIRKRQQLVAESRKYLSAFRQRYSDFLDRYDGLRQRVARLRPDEI